MQVSRSQPEVSRLQDRPKPSATSEQLPARRATSGGARAAKEQPAPRGRAAEGLALERIAQAAHQPWRAQVLEGHLQVAWPAAAVNLWPRNTTVPSSCGEPFSAFAQHCCKPLMPSTLAGQPAPGRSFRSAAPPGCTAIPGRAVRVPHPRGQAVRAVQDHLALAAVDVADRQHPHRQQPGRRQRAPLVQRGGGHPGRRSPAARPSPRATAGTPGTPPGGRQPGRGPLPGAEDRATHAQPRAALQPPTARPWSRSSRSETPAVAGESRTPGRAPRSGGAPRHRAGWPGPPDRGTAGHPRGRSGAGTAGPRRPAPRGCRDCEATLKAIKSVSTLHL